MAEIGEEAQFDVVDEPFFGLQLPVDPMQFVEVEDRDDDAKERKYA